MIRFTQGNLLEADAEALVNTVNTVGVMGKGVALMFKERFPENFKAYERACKDKRVRLGEVFATERKDLLGPKWIINFPTKGHWRYPSRIEWIQRGLVDLARFIREKNIRSVAIPPLGSGNGGLNWPEVKLVIMEALAGLEGVDIIIYEPTAQYQNVAKRTGVEKLTVPRALIAELVRRYSILGIECTLLEVQKLAYFLERSVEVIGLDNTFQFRFVANKFGPYSDRLKHMLDGLGGSYLHCNKRLADAGPFEIIHFDSSKKARVDAFLTSPDAKIYRPALEATTELIDGLESPFGMELLATVDWLIHHEGIAPKVDAIREALLSWPGGQAASRRKFTIFSPRVIHIALDSLKSSKLYNETCHA